MFFTCVHVCVYACMCVALFTVGGQASRGGRVGMEGWMREGGDRGTGGGSAIGGPTSLRRKEEAAKAKDQP